MKPIFPLILCVLIGISVSTAESAPPVRDVVFAKIDQQKLRLDLFLNKNVKKAPLVVFIHGGGWRRNSYKKCLVPWLTDYGFSVASIGYRLTDKAQFPSQIHDCKGAVRWLRAHAKEYNYDASRIAVVGTSAGGYLALMLGVTNGDTELEGKVGGNSSESSRVQAVVDYYGPADFVLRSQNQPGKTEKPNSPVRLLLGVPARKNKKLAAFASPVNHVTKHAPPLLILHGDKDTTVRIDQSQRMVDAYRKVGASVALEVVSGGKHGGSVYFEKVYRKKVAEFLSRVLRHPKK